ncbi:hypothetical protein I302_103898 [Kwoniella bestiolae CBS 10118]|uniref:GIT Spa2 homology (SHD) domain-containing protein n=1 Tax=Kwoniella bestiolae CBS 10118 TaxID=1296100 RepID=A0A1B9G9Q1_9TREE|nr:hypothetical protein I302_02604 [Kwoniella bestiolae CBS 10118]OCF27758.1 hypothetical protein I302_02604 [Kwoniella bestiolae CBS 10118]
MASRFGQPSYSTSPPPTAASSVGYSQYGQSAFGGAPSRQVSTSSSGYQPQARVGNGSTSRSMTGGSGAGGLRPPVGGSSDRKAESREIARVHWRALKEFLASWIEKESPTSRASAREKLTRLTKLQFQELSTDVYDELMRRIAVDNGEPEGNVPFLPVREDFHPKRNQARQKLATLPKNRFQDLASDVFYELKRRYPEFEEQERQYDEPPPAPGPTRPPYQHQHSSSQSLRDRTNPTPPPGALNARLVSSGSPHQRQGSRGMSQGSHRSRPSRDQDAEILDEGRSRGPQANPMGTTSDVVVPNKSRLREEEIEVPYARDSQLMDQRRSRTSSRPASRSSAGRESRASYTEGNDRDREREREKTPRANEELMSPASADDRVYYDRLSFSSNVTNKSKLVAAQNGWDEEREQKLRAEYEFRIAGLDRKVVNAERERDEARRAETSERERRLEWEEEVRGLKERAATHASSLRSLQHELDLAKDAVEAAKQRADQASRTAEEEIAQWRDRYDSLEDEYRRLEDEKANMEGSSSGPESRQAVTELKMELHTLVDELNALSMRNDELMSEREQDAMGMSEMEARVEEYKRKYDAVRIELRNLKATSTLFVSKPLTDDHLPASADGNIADTSVSAFQTAIDGLLQAARSSQPTGVLPAMKAIVEAITEIGEDVKAFEANPNLDVDVSRLESLKYESTNRLNSLMQAARNHAMASGLSPVSLLDAAAGHLSTNVVEIIKLLKIRRFNQNREMSRRRSSMSIKDMVTRDQREKELKAVNGNWDREYGSQERLSEQARASPIQNPPVLVRQPSLDQAPIRTATPTEQRLNGNHPAAPLSLSAGNDRPPAALRINSFQSTSSMGRSDSFDLERKSSMMSDRNGQGQRPLVEPRSGSGFGMNPNVGGGRESMNSQQTQSSAGGGMQGGFAREQSVEEMDEVEEPQGYENDGADDAREWEDLKPYLNTQSSALVNSIQNLLAAIRTNSSPSALNEHLSEVIAIASSIVAVSSNALPNSLRGEGDDLLKDLVSNTNKLSEAQESAKSTGTNGAQGGFEKTVRQQIASASFGVAKSLKALMKLGGAE